MAEVYDDFLKCMEQFKMFSQEARVAGTGKYKKVIFSLNKLMTVLDRLSSQDASGNVPALTEADYLELLDLIGKVQLSVKDFQSTMGKHNALPAAKAMSGLRTLIDRDLHELKNIPVDGKTSLNELLDRVRGRALTVQKVDEKNMKSGATSTRIPVQFEENGKVVRGFYTKGKIYRGNENSFINGSLHAIGAVEESSVTDRNIAMTRVAGLLGCPHLARSSKMQLEIDGQTTDGVFMETAEGEDICGSASAEQRRKFIHHDFSNDALREMADIRVIDFICMNADRHPGNFLYSSREENGKQIITGVMGIDHDYSFGTSEAFGGKIELNKQLGQLKMISESMSLKLSAMNECMFRYALKDLNLKEKEIDEAWIRAQILVKCLEKNKIEVVKDDQFYAKKAELQSIPFSVFQQTEKDISEAAASAQKEDPQAVDESAVNYADAEPVSYLKMNREYIADRLTRMRTSLENAKGYWTSSTENFTRMMTAVKLVETEAVKFKNGTKTEEAFRDDMTKLGMVVESYINYKKNNMVGFGAVARERMGLTVELKEFIEESLSGERKIPELSDQKKTLEGPAADIGRLGL